MTTEYSGTIHGGKSFIINMAQFMEIFGSMENVLIGIYCNHTDTCISTQRFHLSKATMEVLEDTLEITEGMNSILLHSIERCPTNYEPPCEDNSQLYVFTINTNRDYYYKIVADTK